MKWDNVRQLHLEISAHCNAVCPQCARYPTSSHYELPSIKNTDSWTLEQVRQRLPEQDLKNITHYLINGTVGDFIMNWQALEIVQYLSAASPRATIMINTNGSGRKQNFWVELAKIPNLTVSFGIDGMSDTHNLYRRNTDWFRVMDNATMFIGAGGRADWVMTVFQHNQHQVEECANLARAERFNSFFARHSDRKITPAIDRNGQVTHWLLPADDSTIPNLRRNSLQTLRAQERVYKLGKMVANPEHNTVPLPSLDACDSLKNQTIYVGGNWSVAPCCFIGNLSFTQESDHRYANFKQALDSAGLGPEDLVATDEQTVANIVNRGFEWIYRRITTESALTACFNHCHPDKANFKVSQATKIIRQNG